MSNVSYPSPTRFVVDVDGVPMSGLLSAVERPRAIVVAVHGGATTPEYFDAPGFPHQSLLRIGASLGFTVVAPDRPGYGASREVLGERVTPSRQLDLTFGVLDQALAGHDRGAGLFVLGHSQGSVLTARMAAHPRASDLSGDHLLGIEMSGTGVHHSEEARRRIASFAAGGSAGSDLRNLFWQPAYLYRDRERVLSPAPKFDGVDAASWPQDLTELAPAVTVPVRISLGDHEHWWSAGTAGLNSMAELFVSSPRVVVDEQFESGHSTSLGVSALAYHLKVLSFVEECVLMREHAELNSNVKEREHV